MRLTFTKLKITIFAVTVTLTDSGNAQVYPSDRSESIQATLSNGNKISGYVDKSWSTLGKIKTALESEDIGLDTTTHQNYFSDNEFFKTINTFHGIPYANSMSARFQKPSLHNDIWEEDYVFDAKNHAPTCPQPIIEGSADQNGDPNMSEDCLTLDIYSPSPNSGSNANLPVFVWIHGGGLYMGGANSYDSSMLAAMKNMVVVVIQYRLGLLGFYSNPSQNIKGNFGLWDQRTALKWVKQEISNFNGNPNDIYLAGESAGGLSVSAQLYHDAFRSTGMAGGVQMASPDASENLFQKAAIFSGNVNAPWGHVNSRAVNLVNKNLEKMAEEKDEDSVLEMLQDMSVDEIIATQLSADPEGSLSSALAAIVEDGDFFVSTENFVDFLKNDENMTEDQKMQTFQNFKNHQNFPILGPWHITDLSNYKIKYGALNGDGSDIAFGIPGSFSNGLEFFVGFSKFTEDINRNYKIWEHECYRLDLEGLEIDSAACFEALSCFENELYTENHGEDLLNLVNKMDKYFQNENITAALEYTQLINFYTPETEKTKMAYLSDAFFTMPTVYSIEHEYNLNAKIDLISIERKLDADFSFGRIEGRPDGYSYFKNADNGEYAFHGDDVFYLFGFFMCNPYRTSVGYCPLLNASVDDRASVISILKFYFEDVYALNQAFSNYVKLGPSGVSVRDLENGFYTDGASFYDNLEKIRTNLGDKGQIPVYEDLVCEAEEDSYSSDSRIFTSFLMLVFARFL